MGVLTTPTILSFMVLLPSKPHLRYGPMRLNEWDDWESVKSTSNHTSHNILSLLILVEGYLKLKDSPYNVEDVSNTTHGLLGMPASLIKPISSYPRINQQIRLRILHRESSFSDYSRISTSTNTAFYRPEKSFTK